MGIKKNTPPWLLTIGTATIIAMGLVVRAIMSHDGSLPKGVLRVLMDGYWGRLSPIHQSTANADTLLGNVFEPLVDLNPQGGIVPGIAARWEISQDDRLIRFHLRQGVRFSNGTELTPTIYREALLRSVTSEDRDSHNPNALDVLYRIKGFTAEAARKGDVPGLRVESDGALVIEFSTPFRTALAELSGTRYAAWIRDEKGQYLGTGPYQIDQHQDNEQVRYSPNPYAWRSPSYQNVIVDAAKNGIVDLCQGKGQVYIGKSVKSSEVEQACQGRQIEFQGGSIAGHSLIDVNALPGKVFSSPQNRLAIQYLIHSVIGRVLERQIDPRRVTVDPQFFPPLWPGRFSDSEARELIERGRPFVPGLIEATKEKPLIFLSSTTMLRELQEELERLGVKFAKPFATVDVKTVIEAAYGKRDYDLNFSSAMVVGSDPDGLYHLLGKAGALSSPATRRAGVEESMERARSARSGDDLHPLYVEVSRRILSEVPEIHLAFIRNGSFYDRKMVGPKDRGMNSDRFQFDSFVFNQ